ncbi:MAG: LuxR C-terminal-related transcriptional regulator, partial [Anaerolineae bacterium]
MTTPLLETKLYVPPVPPGLVSRPRLIERLNAALPRQGSGFAQRSPGFARKLTLVSAPAGFGKTTLVSSWLHPSGDGRTLSPAPWFPSPSAQAAWLSPDESDNDLVLFLTYIIAALQQIDASLGRTAEMALQAPHPPAVEPLMTALINEIVALDTPFVFVLDDYHTITLSAIHEALTFLLDHMPLQMHLVIATREDPPLPLARLRVGRQVTEIRAADLRFTEEEAAAFLNQTMGLNLTAEDVAALDARTEGWIAGLQLAAISMQGEPAEGISGFIKAFTGSHRYVVDYLVEQVLKRRPSGTRDFLLQTSILGRMTGRLCDAVMQQSAGQAMLELLEEANLFLFPLDHERRWYRYHHLFSDMLRNELQASQPKLVPNLHRRASQWYEQNELIPEAVSHALAAEDYGRAARLVEQRARQMLEQSQLAQLMRLVSALPDEHVRARPRLCVYHAWALRLTGAGLHAVESRLRDAERALEEQPTLPQGARVVVPALDEDETKRLRGHIAALRAYQALYREEIPRAIELAHQALEYRAEGDFVRSSIALALGWAYRFSGDLAAAARALDEATTISQASGNLYLAVAAACRAAHGLVLAGKLRQAARAYEDALQMATLDDGRRLPVAGYAYVYLGGVHREWNDLDTAARYLTEGIDLCTQVGFLMDQVVGYVGLARVRQAQGDPDSARDALQQAERLSRRMTSYLYVRRWVEDCQVRLWLAQGNLDAAVRWADQSGLRADDEVNFLRELERIILARVLVARGRDQPGERYLSDALDLLARLLEAADKAGWMGKAIEILALQALALQAQGAADRALVALERALTLAEPQGYVRTFVDEGAPMARLLQEAVAHGIAPGYAARLLDAFEAREPGAAEDPLAQPATLVDPLTDRELDVLRLLRTDLSGPEIAAALVVSINTVKTHV